ncbi:MAG: hypothetical protein ACRESZ_14530 [Methylococcales bacterium]
MPSRSKDPQTADTRPAPTESNGPPVDCEDVPDATAYVVPKLIEAAEKGDHYAHEHLLGIFRRNPSPEVTEYLQRQQGPFKRPPHRTRPPEKEFLHYLYAYSVAELRSTQGLSLEKAVALTAKEFQRDSPCVIEEVVSKAHKRYLKDPEFRRRAALMYPAPKEEYKNYLKNRDPVVANVEFQRYLENMPDIFED